MFVIIIISYFLKSERYFVNIVKDMRNCAKGRSFHSCLVTVHSIHSNMRYISYHLISFASIFRLKLEPSPR